MKKDRDNFNDNVEQSFLMYATDDGEIRVSVRVEGETIWLSQSAIAELFACSSDNISLHIQNIYESGELRQEATTEDFSVVRKEGNRQVNRTLRHYNLDAIIAVGYRVNSRRATQFRIWATQVLKEYMIKGFALDDERLKQGNAVFGEDYFRELLERVRSIRASERRIYQQITDIFAECSIDYRANSDVARDFFAEVQNLFHYAITGLTAPEIIASTADKDKPNFGLVTWKNAPEGRILRSDVVVAKKYLSEKELKQLERTVSGFFDYIERIIETRTTFTMIEFAESVRKFLSFNEYQILEGKGKVSRKIAEKKALSEYKEFNKTQPIVSDFDKLVKRISQNKK